MTVTQARGPAFVSQCRIKTQAQWYTFVNPAMAGEIEDQLVSEAHWAANLAELNEFQIQ